MSDAFFYPELDQKTIKNLEVVRQLMLEHPSYWLTSPYPQEIERLCTEWFKGRRATAAAASLPEYDDEDDLDAGASGDWEFLYSESRKLYRDLQAAGTGMDPNDKMAYFRTSTSLLEKLLGMQERANNLKQISDFYHLVMDIMEGVLSPTQRTEVMERLEQATKGG